MVGVDVRLVYQMDQTSGRTEPPAHTGVEDALLGFIQQPPSPGTFQELSRFEAIQERFERRVDAQVLTDMPSSSIERPPSLETPALIHGWMLTYMDVAPAPPVNGEAFACMPSSSFQQPYLPETHAAQTPLVSRGTGGVAGSTPLPMKIPRPKVAIQTLRALRDALARDAKLDMAEWARTNRVRVQSIKYLVHKGELTPEAQNRLDVADGKAPRFRRVEGDDLRALRDALAANEDLDVIAWARQNRLNSRTMECYVSKGALTPEAQNQLDRAEGKAPRFRLVEVVDMLALRDALAQNSGLDVTAWARARHLNARTVRSFVRKGALRPQVLGRLQKAIDPPTEPERTVEVAAVQAPTPRRGVEPRDLRTLLAERAGGGVFDLPEWAERFGLKLHELIRYVTVEGELTAKGLDLLNRR
jgi:plasmid maintenance system antidote protein VapI